MRYSLCELDFADRVAEQRRAVPQSRQYMAGRLSGGRKHAQRREGIRVGEGLLVQNDAPVGKNDSLDPLAGLHIPQLIR